MKDLEELGRLKDLGLVTDEEFETARQEIFSQRPTATDPADDGDAEPEEPEGADPEEPEGADPEEPEGSVEEGEVASPSDLDIVSVDDETTTDSTDNWWQASDGLWYPPEALDALKEQGWFQGDDGQWYPPPQTVIEEPVAASLDQSTEASSEQAPASAEPAAEASATTQDRTEGTPEPDETESPSRVSADSRRSVPPAHRALETSASRRETTLAQRLADGTASNLGDGRNSSLGWEIFNENSGSLNTEQEQSVAELLGPGEKLLHAQNGFRLDWELDPEGFESGNISWIPILTHWWVAVTSLNLRYGQFHNTPIPYKALGKKLRREFRWHTVNKRDFMTMLPVIVGSTIWNHSVTPLGAVSNFNVQHVGAPYDGRNQPDDGSTWRWQAVPNQLGLESGYSAMWGERGEVQYYSLAQWTAENNHILLYSAHEDFQALSASLANAQTALLKQEKSHPADGSGTAEGIDRLAELFQQGLLSEEEFEASKSRILGL